MTPTPDWSAWLLVPALAWITHCVLVRLSALVEPRCRRCGGRRWTQGRQGELVCASCPVVKEQLEMELAA
ncbi:MAG TPA: hypothetical protein VHG28_09535 [Longimicrobiaceae bacterium]|nr:hypothetical protein [Longimicrobiaceae bacterium]